MKLRMLIVLLLSILLAGCTLGGKPADGPESVTVKNPAVPAITGRLFFQSPTAVTMLESGKRTTIPLPAGTKEIALAPNAQSLAVVVHEADGAKMLLIPVAGSPRRVFATDWHATPIWSPDSSQFALLRGRSVRIWSVREGRGVTVPTPPKLGLDTATWSADGSYLVAGPRAPAGLWLIDVKRRTVTLVEKPARMGAWAPDDKRFIYVRPDTKGDSVVAAEPGKPGTVIFSKETLLAARPDLAHLFDTNILQSGNLTWTPDGKSVVFVFKAAGPDNPRYTLVTFGHDGTGIHALVLPVYPEADKDHHPPRPCQPINPSFTTGGAEIMVALSGPGCDNTVLRLKTATLEQVGESAREALHTELSPDRAWAYVYGETFSEITLFPMREPGRRTSLQVQGRFLAWLP